MFQKISEELIKRGYRFLKVQPEETGVYYKYDSGLIRVIILVSYREGFYLTPRQAAAIQERLRTVFTCSAGRIGGFPEDAMNCQVDELMILCAADMDGVREICAQNSNTWAVDEINRQFILYENQPGNFDGIKDMLEALLEDKWEWKKWPIATIVIAGLNIIIWIAMELIGDTTDGLFMAEHGAMYPDFILQNGQWWCLFTAMFLHFGAQHLANNMVILCFTGNHLEKALGRIKYLLVYLLSGLCGNLLSLYMMVKGDSYAVSAGASGAIFGVIGALVYTAIRNRGKFEGLTARGLLFMIALCLYYGISASGVNNWAHIGGLLGGFLFCAVFYRKHRTS